MAFRSVVLRVLLHTPVLRQTLVLPKEEIMQLLTEYHDLPRGEYPRPQMVRREWICLNGTWQFALDPEKNGEKQGWTCGVALPERIVVPFCPESRLSGIGNPDFMPCVWYRRELDIPEAWRGRRILLHCGAADYAADVWVNGRHVGHHRGGYTPFTFDITNFLRSAPNELVMRVLDDTLSPLQPTGKQSRRRESYRSLYTRTTGIWQTAWLEAVPPEHIAALRLTPDLEDGCVHAEIFLRGTLTGLTCRAVIMAKGEKVVEAEVAAAPLAQVRLMLPHAHPWSPASPFLYDLDVVLCRGTEEVDRVSSYFGIRQLKIRGHEFLLNGRRLFQRLVLDQGYYPDGIYTAPSDHALRRDIELAQALGFNGARLHQKVFEPRFLYWADRLGYLVWGEYPSWGFDHAAPEALAVFLPEWGEAVRRDFNHPAIIGWCPFNETLTTQDPALIRCVYRFTKAFDPTRPVIDTSGYVHVETDVYDSHNYEQDIDKFKAIYQPFATNGAPYRNRPHHDCEYRGQPYFVSEYGGIWWNPNQKDDKGWGYGERPNSLEEFMLRYRGLTDVLLGNPKICGYCYTQLYDVEQEVNGLCTYNRDFKFDPAEIRAVNLQPAAYEVH